MENVKKKIQELVDYETKGWNTKNPDLFLSIIHPDMVWSWPPHQNAHNPVHWVFKLGRFNYKRWRKNWQDIFDNYDLVHNKRDTIKIEVSKEGDGAYAVVDIDTLWRHKETRKDFHWKGRVCKIYTKMPNGEWKLIAHTGALHYSALLLLQIFKLSDQRKFGCQPIFIRSLFRWVQITKFWMRSHLSYRTKAMHREH